MLLFKKPGGPNAKAGRPNAKAGGPNASQWNIVRVGLGLRCYPVFFMLGTKREHSFQWNMGLSLIFKPPRV